MVIVRIADPKIGLHGVPLIKLIRDATGLLLKPSKELGEKVLAGETIEVEVSSPRKAKKFVRELIEIGAIASCED